MNFGMNEIKLQINAYGESLGLNEQKLGILLSIFYLEAVWGLPLIVVIYLNLKYVLHKKLFSCPQKLSNQTR